MPPPEHSRYLWFWHLIHMYIATKPKAKIPIIGIFFQITCNPPSIGVFAYPWKIKFQSNFDEILTTCTLATGIRQIPRFSKMFLHYRSNVTPSGRIKAERLYLFSFLYLFFFLNVCGHDKSWNAQPIPTKFSHMTFDCNSSAKFENRHRRSHVTAPNRGFLHPPPRKFNITIERLNQSEPNFHTWHLTGIARPSSKMGIAGHM